MSAGEKKRETRRHLIYFSDVHDRDNRSFKAKLADITKEGLMVISEEKVELEKVFHLEIILPEEVDGRDKINLKAKSKWCKKDVNPDYFATGLEVEEIDIIDEELIEYLIYEYGFND
ncbi:MAG: PilZ domain-containing protein [bacterium]|nr:PilZ domain-containing protein [bacterium]